MTSWSTHFLEFLWFAAQHGTSAASKCTSLITKKYLLPWLQWLPTMPFQYLIPMQSIEKNASTFFFFFFAVHKPRIQWKHTERFPISLVLIAFYWHITGRKHNPIISKHISVLEDTVSHCVVLKAACLQRKMSFAHVVNCTLPNVRFKGQTTSLRLYKDCRIKLLFLRGVMLSA